MTNRQALNLASICSILTNSKQFSFGVIRRLAKNAKIIDVISKEVQEIIKLGKDKEKTDDEIKEEVETFESEEFKGEFEPISLSIVDEVKTEIINYKNNAGELSEIDILAGLLILENNDILK